MPPALPAAWVGLLLFRQLEPAYLNLLLGLFLISNLPLVLRRQREIETVPQAGNIAWLPVVGTLAGFVSGTDRSALRYCETQCRFANPQIRRHASQ
ncbi:hypothetical protein [Gluconobacter sp. DsW_056]|uniref:hypothetical protein n=1 Tax=Gluconobacter sp. DsW_056 TaxID=1511209 RepID=UPI001E336729|nr:hypothetical protein [Gluconobacter sp. DsW_056]